MFLSDKGDIVAKGLPPAFREHGYRRAEFQSDAITNVNGLWIPTRFEYRAYRPVPEAKGENDLLCILLVKGEATNISTRVNQWNLDLPGKRFFVHDVRGAGRMAVYPITNGLIPPLSGTDVKRARLRAEKIYGDLDKHRARNANTIPRVTLYIVFGISLPALGFFAWRLKDNKNKPRQKGIV